MSKVFFIKNNFLPKLGISLKKFPLEQWKGKKVAIKLHMGEYGNLNYVRPPIAGKIVEVLKEAGAQPFLIDSTTLYKAKRHTPKQYLDTARRNGFTEETMGCPIIASNQSVQRQGKLFPVGVIKEIVEADAMLVLTHAKGHAFSALAGAIKNLGMGAVDRSTKMACHDKANMKVSLEKCIGCGSCLKVCPVSAISLKNGKASIGPGCWGCGKCFKVCPQKAMSPKEFLSDHGLANCALAALECFGKKDLLFVSILMDISDVCDCHGDASFAHIQNIGFLLSQDILAIENASVDLINKAAGGDFFDKIGYRDPKQQIEWLEKEGYGSREYSLEEV